MNVDTGRAGQNRFERLIDGIGVMTSFMILALIGLLGWGVFARYGLNRPSIWANELATMLYAVYFLIGGSFAMVRKQHVNVDIVHGLLSARPKAITDIATSLLFFIYIGILFWLSISFAADSVGRLERSSSIWAPYIWPVKLILPVSTGLMLLVGLMKLIRDLKVAFGAREPQVSPTHDHESIR
jgi:TRAP-type mannitol/chloroaromatic compound transport system permease small subunit